MLKDKLTNNEWVIAYIWADWCKVCQTNKEVVDQLIKDTPDIAWIKLNAMEDENKELLRQIDFETLPYFAVFHTAKEGYDSSDPMTAFVGGDSGGGRELPEQMVAMIRQFKSRDVVA